MRGVSARQGLVCVAGALALGCQGVVGGEPGPCDVTYELLGRLRIDQVAHPTPVVPGTELVVRGESFIPDPTCVTPVFSLRGPVDGVEREALLRGEVRSVNEVVVTVTAEAISDLGGEGSFAGLLSARFVPVGGGGTFVAYGPVSFGVADALAPVAGTIEQGPEVYLDDELILGGRGFIGGAEGMTEVVVDGSFSVADTGREIEVRQLSLPSSLVDPADRTRVAFLWSPLVGGLAPGSFQGRLTARNRHASGVVAESPPVEISLEQRETVVLGIEPETVSLGQIATVRGRGFVGSSGGSTVIRLEGQFAHDEGPTVDASVSVVATWRDGTTLEYPIAVSAESGELRAADFGASRGRFTGTATAIVTLGTEQRAGLATEVSMVLGPIRQVAWVRFMPGFSASLEIFGLGATEGEVRARVLQRMQELYCPPDDPAGCVNVEFRADEPTDFYAGAYAMVDIGGPDPNGIGMFGYDNTAGKDVGNLRLHDHIGGENAFGALDGFGYGGVFIESMLYYSEHPPFPNRPLNAPVPVPRFDDIFDPVREDEVVAGEWPSGPDPVRARQIEEAIHALSSIIADTAAHEFAHSLGLAQPYGRRDAYHDDPPGPGCLMDAGGQRPFEERARIDGNPGAFFCSEDMAYLLDILPRE